ncbi:amidohydrolase family protein [Aristophania vespae]|uniref:Amidohydrolase family protein n=1 Tax=Aristophania vespae TaxID=2697033 RepID=A0A6P1N9R5_9PROT|nr:dihydroorotase [Aristophania vespae]QHI95156.1 amidohydrolase family protein [Aristophania vespae]UMM64372.1 Dihydroorotase [Aristophania vespae]
MNNVIFKNIRLIDPANGRDEKSDLVVHDGKIIGFSAKDAPKDAYIIDGKGAVLCPGLVDMRVSLGEPGAEYRESIDSGAQAAVAGGITSLTVLPDTQPSIDTPALVSLIKQRGRETGLVSLYPYGALTRDCAGKDMTEMGLLKQAGAIGFTDGARTLSDAKQMRNLLAYSRFLNALIVLHPEEPSLAKGGCATAGALAVQLGLPQIPAEAEAMMVARDLRLAEMTGARVHFAHISTAEALDLIRGAKAKGLAVTCDTAPPYFTMTEDAIGDFRTYAKLSPPLRQERDRLAVLAALADGTIDVIASDHAPADADDKRLPFAQARAGGTGLVTLLGVTLKAGLPLIDSLRLLTSAPARLLGLDAGTLSLGAEADLCMFDPDAEWTVKAGKLPGRAQNTPFDGLTLKGKVLRTFRAGKEVYTDRTLQKGNS